EDAVHTLQQRSQELETLELTDPLTGLLNRRAIDDVARLEIRRHARYGNPIALGVVDIDCFREINRRYLLPGADQVLIGIAKAVISSIRAVYTVGRIGGDEFLIVAPETDLKGAQTLAKRIRATVEATQFSYKGETIPVTISVGFAVAEAGVVIEYDE